VLRREDPHLKRGEQILRILVAGGAGYIGSHACKALAKEGHVPIVIDDLSTGNEWAVRWGALVHGSIGDQSLVERVLRTEKIDAVMLFAASAYVGESMTNPKKYFQNNVVNTLTLLDAMREAGVRDIVFSSSCATYGDPIRLPIDETHPQNPVNPYGESKLFIEKVLRWYGGAYGQRWVALRYFNAGGADVECEIGEVHDPEPHLIPLVIQAARGERPEVGIFGTDYSTPDGSAVRDYIHVEDLAQAHILAVEHLAAGGESGAFNLGTGHGYSVREVIGSVEKHSGLKVPAVDKARRPGDPDTLVASAERARKVLGWKPVHDLDSIVATAWAWDVRKSENPPKIQKEQAR
jgi:UDP-glucose-4-epimerase GalE